MTALDIYQYAQRLGLTLGADGEQLLIYPGSRCPPDFVETLRENKKALLALLELKPDGLSIDRVPWLHIARQVLAGEFDGGDRSLLESLHIGLSNIAHPACQAAKAKLEIMLGHRKGRPNR
jgi:hypothetical protein